MARPVNPRNRYGPSKLNEEVFVENSTYPRHRLKERIKKQNLIPYICSDCGQDDQWNNKVLVLQLEHINGVNDDHRLENLTFLCPNCHTQTECYAARNRKNVNRKSKQWIKRV